MGRRKKETVPHWAANPVFNNDLESAFGTQYDLNGCPTIVPIEDVKALFEQECKEMDEKNKNTEWIHSDEASEAIAKHLGDFEHSSINFKDPGDCNTTCLLDQFFTGLETAEDVIKKKKRSTQSRIDGLGFIPDSIRSITDDLLTKSIVMKVGMFTEFDIEVLRHLKYNVEIKKLGLGSEIALIVTLPDGNEKE